MGFVSFANPSPAGLIWADLELTKGLAHITGMLKATDWEQVLRRYIRDTVDKAVGTLGIDAASIDHALPADGHSANAAKPEPRRSGTRSTVPLPGEIPVPIAGRPTVLPKDSRLEIRHPVSCERTVLEGLTFIESDIRNVASEILKGIESPRERFFALWRLLPERMERRFGSQIARLPADARVPDHTVFHRADILAGIGTSQCAEHGSAIMSLSLGPVQPFIAAARTVRDLWSGSAVLSWLTFQGLLPVVDRYGPTALAFPVLRGNPLMDLWLRGDGGLGDRIDRPTDQARRAPSIPNRFVALVPSGPDGSEARKMAALCEDAVKSAWRHLSREVHGLLDPELREIDIEWSRRWSSQVDEFFEVRVSVMPTLSLGDRELAEILGDGESFEVLWPDAAAVRELAAAIPEIDRPMDSSIKTGQWQAQMEASARLMEAQRAISHIPASCGGKPSPAKCSLLGSFEQMGPNSLEDGQRFWQQAKQRIEIRGTGLRSGERFSAIALCKRFASPALLRKELELPNTRFPDTATIAATDWLKREGVGVLRDGQLPAPWNGHWLHQASGSYVEAGERPPRDILDAVVQARRRAPPPSYYAILNMDADNMGNWLSGRQGPKVRTALSPELLNYFESLGATVRRGLDAQRPVGPMVHAAIGEALNNFASHIAPVVIGKHSGTAIYSGGDDVLALMPSRQGTACAYALQRAFRGFDSSAPPGMTRFGDRTLAVMGNEATMSAGIAFVHIKEDLRAALEAAREAEASSKKCGKNSVTLRFMRRSGEHAQTVVGWETASWFQELVGLIAGGATDRWTYRLRAELPTLTGDEIPDPAVTAEIRRIVDRSNDGRDAPQGKLTGATAQGWWHRFKEAEKGRHDSTGDLLTAFVTVCQGASLVARGFDD